MEAIKNRYEVVALVEARMCNPNGDPDMANRPRTDFETDRGIITDVAFKARMRQYVLDTYAGKDGYDILMQNGASINKAIAEAVLSVNKTDKLAKGNNTKVNESADAMCSKYWDVRAFGAVMSTGLNAGQVRGAAQVGMSLSVDPIAPEVMTVTRRSYSDTKDSYETLQEYIDEENARPGDKKRTMGTKAYIPYGLYIFRMSISANLASKVGFSEEDLKVLLESLIQMYDNDVSSSKMGMSVLAPVVVFKHVGVDNNNPEQQAKEALLGCAPAYKLFDMLSVERKDGVDAARSYNDYDINLDLSKLPAGVKCGIKNSAYADIQWLDSHDKLDLINM